MSFYGHNGIHMKGVRMNDLIVTISRQNGSGGREVGNRLAEMLGIKCYDQEIISATAAKAGMSVAEVRRSEERPDGVFTDVSTPEPLFQAQSDVIRDLAARGSCVIVGRSADYVLRGRPNVVTVFIHAPVSVRVERSKAHNGFTDKVAYETVTRKDRERAQYYHRNTGKVWGELSNYHLTIDTGMIGTDNAAQLIKDFIDMRDPKMI